jgi:hypothetical protein
MIKVKELKIYTTTRRELYNAEQEEIKNTKNGRNWCEENIMLWNENRRRR